jgi:phosphoglycolate phosphatase-like HAD superfamily hydrolase
MTGLDPRPDLAIFDIDGTLLATDAFWLELGLGAVRAVYDRHGLDRALPSTDRFLDAIGLPIPAFWHAILPEDLRRLTDEIEAEAQELEEAAFAKGHGAMYPGARQLLTELAERGVRLGLASNCGRRYLESFLASFALEPLITEARCLDSPGVTVKADMVADILACADTRNAVMIGDRSSDREAARANGIPFVLFTGGFGEARPEPSDHVAADYGAVRALLLGEAAGGSAADGASAD